VIPGSAWRSLTGTPFGGVSWRCQLAVSVGGVSWRSQLAESVGGLACRSDLAVRLGGVPWPDVDPLRIDQCAPMGWHRSNARAVIRGSTWRSLTSTQFGGVSWRSGLAEWLGGVAWRSVLAAHPALASPQINPRRSIQHGEFVRREIGNWLLSLSVSRSDCFRPPYCLRTSPTESCQLNRVPMPPTPREISHPEPQCTPRFPGAASAARGHPGVSRIAPRAICPSRSQFSCREPLRPPEVHVASWCGNNLTTPAVPQTCSPQLRHANSPSRTPLTP